MIRVVVKTENVYKALGTYADPTWVKKVGKNLLLAGARGGAKVAKRALRNVAGRRTGALQKSIKGTLSRKDKALAIIGPAGSKQFMKAWGIEQGYTIQARDPERGLRFRVGGQWVRKQLVVRPARPWFRTSVGNYLDSPALRQAMDKQLEKELQKVQSK